MHISARGMVSKHNNHFAHNGRENQLQQRTIGNHNNIRAAIAPYRKPYKSQASTLTGNEMSFSASCQMPSDPLYIDFNNPTPMPQPHRQNAGNKNAGGGAGTSQPMPKKKGPKGKQRPIGGGCGVGNGIVKQQHGINGNWHPKHRNHISEHQRFNGAGGGMQRGGIYNGSPNTQLLTGPPNRGVGSGRIMLPPPPMGMRVGPMPPRPPMGYQPVPPPPAPLQSMRGRMPPLGMHAPPLPPPPHFMRRNGVGGPMPSMPPLMCGPRMPARGPPPHMQHFNAVVGGGGGGGNPCFGNNNMHTHGSNHNNSGKIKKPNAHLVKQAVKGKSTIKTLKTLVNQYPIDKPWVNDEIRAEHTKKIDIENRLRGNKNDELFAQFKVQRDKFVALYEAARELYLKQEAANVMSAKDAKDKETITNKNANTAIKVGNGKAAIPNQTVKKNNQTNITKSAAEKKNNAEAQQQQQQQQQEHMPK